MAPAESGYQNSMQREGQRRAKNTADPALPNAGVASKGHPGTLKAKKHTLTSLLRASGVTV